MARPKIHTIDVADADLTGFASNVTGATFTLTATAATDGLAHQVSIRNDSATDHSGKTVTLVGTNPDGAALTEVVTGPAGSATVESAGYFLTLTSATPSATIGADTFDIGWVDEVLSNTIPLNWRSENGATLSVVVTGTIDFSIEETFQDVLSKDVVPYTNTWAAITALATKTANTTSTSTAGATAVRIKINSYDSGGAVTMSRNQTYVVA